MKSLTKLSKLLILGLLLVLAVSYISAQTPGFEDPPDPPPTGNSIEPLNIGPADQIKPAKLTIEGFFQADGDSLFNQDLTVQGDTELNANKIDILGDLSVTGQTTIGGILQADTMDIGASLSVKSGISVNNRLTIESLSPNSFVCITTDGILVDDREPGCEPPAYPHGSIMYVPGSSLLLDPWVPCPDCTTNTFVVPPGIRTITAKVQGAGGGGGGGGGAGLNDSGGRGGGGGGGGYVVSTFAVNPGAVYYAVIGYGGAGGGGGSAGGGDGTSGNPGGNTSFGTIFAYGGLGGGAGGGASGFGSNSGSNGGGGTGNSGTGGTITLGGNGGVGSIDGGTGGDAGNGTAGGTGGEVWLPDPGQGVPGSPGSNGSGGGGATGGYGDSWNKYSGASGGPGGNGSVIVEW